MPEKSKAEIAAEHDAEARRRVDEMINECLIHTAACKTPACQEEFERIRGEVKNLVTEKLLVMSR